MQIKEVFPKTIWGEARGESPAGKRAVACVILNRVRVSEQLGEYWWGNTIEQVCLKPYQFSCWNSGDPNREKMLAGPKDEQYLACQIIADQVLTGKMADNTKGSTHYYNIHTKKPKWAEGEEPLVTIGNHAFYRPKEVRDLKVKS